MVSENTTIEKDLKSHWDHAYDRAPVNTLGWYEDYPEPSLRLIAKCNLNKKAPILNVGAGATTLVDELIKQGYENIIANEISSTALEKLKARLGDESKKVHWVVDDLTHPTRLIQLGNIDLWHDRAVLHFFIEPEDQNTYFNLLKKLVSANGYVIIATFNLTGPQKCSGLPVQRYDQQMLQTKLGDDFKIVEAFDFTYFTPSGDPRDYLYTLFKRESGQ